MRVPTARRNQCSRRRRLPPPGVAAIGRPRLLGTVRRWRHESSEALHLRRSGRRLRGARAKLGEQRGAREEDACWNSALWPPEASSADRQSRWPRNGEAAGVRPTEDVGAKAWLAAKSMREGRGRPQLGGAGRLRGAGWKVRPLPVFLSWMRAVCTA